MKPNPDKRMHQMLILRPGDPCGRHEFPAKGKSFRIYRMTKQMT
jgi:hypothetical protein